MTLGGRIMNLRIERQMSQSDLAEALDVSRQSISKWETDSSVPELDNLIMLCDIFGVTMDMLVRGLEKESIPQHKDPLPQQNTSEEKQEIVHVVKFETRKIVGILLLICAILCALAGTFLGDFVAGMLLALPFIVCGVLCLTCKSRVGLWCAWTVYLYAEVFLRFATGVSSGLIWLYLQGHVQFGINVMISIAELLLIIGLAVGTVWSFRNNNIRALKASTLYLSAAWASFILLRCGLGIMLKFVMIRSNMQFLSLLYILIKDWILYIFMVILLIWTYHWWKYRKVLKS